MLTLLVARHGNTFEDYEPLRRVGARTDLPLTEKGREQAKALGCYLKKNNLIPDSVYCSELKRTRETAELALKEMDCPSSITTSAIFNEIDYGIDENKLESEVTERIGIKSLLDWEENFIVPNGWIVNIDDILLGINNFLFNITTHRDTENKLILIVTSNGIARFFTKIADLSPNTPLPSPLKLGTGCLSKLSYNNNLWSIDFWNTKP